MVYFLGTLGNLLFGVKSLFQVIQCYRRKSTEGLSLLMLITDFLGNTLCAYFIFETTGFRLWPQFVNYSLASLWLVILFGMMVMYKH